MDISSININIDFLINTLLAIITMSLGLSLARKDFSNLFLNPKAITIGLVAQIVFLPLIAYYLVVGSELPPEVKVGFIIISVCPGGVTSNLVSFISRGNVALSISLTVLNGVITLFSIPILVNIAIDLFIGNSEMIELPFGSTLFSIFMVTILPAIVGMAIKTWRPAVAKLLQKPLRIVLPLLLLLIFVIKLFANEDQGGIALTKGEIIDQAPYALLLNVLGMFFGYVLGWLFSISFKNRITIIIEVGLQNTALALLIAGTMLKNHNMEKPAMVYAMLTFVSTLAVAYITRILFKWYLNRQHHMFLKMFRKRPK